MRKNDSEWGKKVYVIVLYAIISDVMPNKQSE